MYVGMYETFSITMISANVRMGIQFRNQQGKVQINHNWFRRLIEQFQYLFLRYHDNLLLTRQMRSRP